MESDENLVKRKASKIDKKKKKKLKVVLVPCKEGKSNDSPYSAFLFPSIIEKDFIIGTYCLNLKLPILV